MILPIPDYRQAYYECYGHEPPPPAPYRPPPRFPGLPEFLAKERDEREREAERTLLFPEEGGYEAVHAATLALQRGAVLHVTGLTAGHGLLVDWRTVRSGEQVAEGPEALLAIELVRRVGPGEVLEAMGGIC